MSLKREKEVGNGIILKAETMTLSVESTFFSLGLCEILADISKHGHDACAISILEWSLVSEELERPLFKPVAKPISE